MKKIIKNNFVYILAFIFFFIILSLAPIAGDDWGNYGLGAQGIKTVLNVAKGMYFSWEGRFISRIIICIFTYHKFLFVFITSLLLTITIFLANQIIGTVKNKIVYFLPLLVLLLLLLNVYSISQTFTWVAGSVTYLYPSVITVSYFYYLYQKKEFKFSIIEFTILSFINIITPMFVENIGLSFVIGNVIWLILQCKEKTSEKIKFLIMTIFSIIAIIIMLSSPGSALRMAEQSSFYSMSLYNKIFLNLPNFISYTFTKNSIVLICMLWSILYTLKKQGVKFIWLFLFSIIPILGIIQNIYLIIPFDIKAGNWNFWGPINVNSWYFIFYWALFGIMFFYSIFKNSDDENERKFLIFLTFIATCAIGSMLVTPVWGERVAIFSEIVYLIVSLRILKNIFTFKYNKFIITFISIVILHFIIMFSLIYIVNHDRNIYINKQLQNENISKIYIYDNFINYIWGLNPYDEYHIQVFKKYYGINQEVDLVFVKHKTNKIIKDIE